MTWQALMKEELERLRQADIPEADSTDALPSSLTVFPPPLRTLIPSKERITVLLSLI